MTVSSTTTSVTVQGDGLSTVFNYTFPMGGSASYAVLTLTDGGGVTSTITSSLFSITGVTTSTGGTFTYPLAGSAITAGESLTLTRTLPLTQNSDIANQGNFYASVVTGALDYQMMVSQQLEAEIDTIQTAIDTITTSTGSGTVTYVATGTGLSGGPITTTGTITLSTITTGMMLGNFSGATAAPQGVTIAAGTGASISSTTTSLTISAPGASISTGMVVGNFSGATAAPQGVTVVQGTGISIVSTTTSLTIAATGAGGAGSYTLLASATPSSTASVVFSSITNSYSTLKIIGMGRSTTTGTGSDPVLMTFNNDTASNYVRQFNLANQTTNLAIQSTAQTAIYAGELNTTGDIATYPSSFEVTIPFYAGTTFYKGVLVHYLAFNANNVNALFDITEAGCWASTSAISQINLTLTGNWVTGSQVSLYGLT